MTQMSQMGVDPTRMSPQMSAPIQFLNLCESVKSVDPCFDLRHLRHLRFQIPTRSCL
jgi:hypothetical protein